MSGGKRGGRQPFSHARPKTGPAQLEKTASRIFISYRREDSIAYAGRLYDHLSAHFAAERVFMDIGQIEAGDDFVNVLDREIEASDVVIALIGPRWLSASNENGRRLDQPDDFVSHELAAALEQGKRLIPVLVGGATMPDAKELPPALAELARRQAHVLDDKRFKFELDALIRSIERRPSLLSQFVQVMNAERLRKWRRYSGAGVALLPDLVYRPWSLEGDRIDSRDVSGSLPMVQVGVVWRKGSTLPRTARDFIAIAQTQRLAR